jgi:MPBQ/MSBQ methyltransferase
VTAILSPIARPDTSNPECSYDGSKVVYRLLRLETWGSPLMNLGYFGYRGLFAPLNLMSSVEGAQNRMVLEAAKLLGMRGEQDLLDVACGRGKSSYLIQCLHPNATVTGVDLLEQHTATAQTLFGGTRNLSYQTGNAMDLDFADESFDRVLCLEAAFHFPDRAEFLREADRVLRPGGRLVVVDFAWNTEADRVQKDHPKTMLVRDVWQWDDFFSLPEYQATAREIGFRVAASHDWSSRVTAPLQLQFGAVLALAKTSLGRRLLEWRNPLYRSLSRGDWHACVAAVAAHAHVQRHSKYMAFVFEKPLAG